MVEKNNIVVLQADLTNESPEIEHWLKKFNSISIPLTTIFSASRPTEPFVLRDVYTKSKLLKYLEKAVAETRQAGVLTRTSANVVR